MKQIIIEHDAYDEDLLIFSLKRLFNKYCNEGKMQQFKVTSQSAKPEQPTNSCTPCLAEIQDSRHSGTNDGEVNEDNRAVKKLCGCYRLTIGKVPIPNCKYCHGTGWIDLILECDPEGMKPKSKYEKAFRDVNE